MITINPIIIVAEVEAVIPSMLSNMFTEFIIPITQKAVNAKSRAGTSVM
jgi:hypothetical protein